MTNRRRAAAVIIRDGRLLMVREREKGPDGRHDGHEYWTLPGGGIEEGETPEQAVVREVYEEVGLSVLTTDFLYEVPYPSGLTACYRAEVDSGEPTLGAEPDPDCDCPRLTGLGWIPLSRSTSAGDPVLVPTLLIATPAASATPIA